MALATIEPRVRNGWAVVLATGPSLTAEDVALATRYRDAGRCALFGVNDAYRIADLDVLYACDPEWWDHHHERTEGLRAACYSQSGDGNRGPHRHVEYVRGAHKEGFSTRADCIHYGNNSGYQVLNLAYLMGYRSFILLGYDMGPGVDGKTHFFGDHPPGIRRASNHKAFAMEFARIPCAQLGVRIINSTRRTYLECFELLPLETALELTSPAALP